MHRKLFAALLILSFALPGFAESLEERVDRLEKELAILKAQVAQSLQLPTVVGPVSEVKDKQQSLMEIVVSSKKFQDIDFAAGVSNAGVYWDIQYTSRFDKAVRAVKGKVVITDLFDELKLSIGWTIDVPLKSGETKTEKGRGIRYNQFMAPHQWLRNTDIKDMKFKFIAEQVIYEDGSKAELK
ncbi:MAG: hypothetical protein H0W78_01860 [Planctomycetes bacterium]|nr:hypothetical protein [Planctomycetota bacterium]